VVSALVNNAGIGTFVPVEFHPINDFDYIYQVH
jgi:short-subunit dehydrogenase